MITTGKVDTSDLMMIITWAINISFQSPELKWVSWTHTTPYILMTKVIERTSSMLDTHPQDKLYRRLQVFNACEHSWIMMIMGSSKMSKTEYDFKAICILPMTYPKNTKGGGGGGGTISSNPDYYPIMQTDPYVSSNAPSLGSSGEPGHPLYDIVFSWGGGGGERAFLYEPFVEIWLCNNGKHSILMYWPWIFVVLLFLCVTDLGPFYRHG